MKSLLVVTTLLVVSACSGSTGHGEASCALALQYQGRTYYALTVAKPPTAAEPFSEVRFSPCDDTGGQADPGGVEAEDARARFQAVTLEGIDPAVAFVVPSHWPGYIFVSGAGNASTFAPEVERLLDH